MPLKLCKYRFMTWLGLHRSGALKTTSPDLVANEPRGGWTETQNRTINLASGILKMIASTSPKQFRSCTRPK